MPDGSNFGGNFGGDGPGSGGGTTPFLPGRDSEIISYCAAIWRLHQVSGEMYHAPACNSPAERAMSRTDGQLYELEAKMVRHMCKLRAQSMEAQYMRARLLNAWFPENVRLTWADCRNATAIVNALVRDTLSNAVE